MMTTWTQYIATLLGNLEEDADRIKDALGARLGTDQPFVVVPYTGYASYRHVRVQGRVLRNPDILPSNADTPLLTNIWDMYRRIESDEMPNPTLSIQLADHVATVRGDEEGFFAADLDVALTPGTLQRSTEARVTLLDGASTQMSATVAAPIVVPAAAPAFGIVSDLDDTVLKSYATEPLKMLATMLTSNAETRRPFAGVAAFYQCLHARVNPVFYVSSSPWNLYDLLSDFMALQEMPLGPLLLRDWGISEGDGLPIEHVRYKTQRIIELLAAYPSLSFLLLGDNGQHDPEVYLQIAQQYPGRVAAVLIRTVDLGEERREAVASIAAEFAALGTPYANGETSLEMAAAAAEMGFVATSDLPRIAAAKV